MTSDRLRQIERIYRETFERAEAERDVFFSEACAGDSELRIEVRRRPGQRRPALESATRRA